MASLSNIKSTMYQGRPEGAVRKMHRLTMKADNLEKFGKLFEALECHYESKAALVAYIQTDIESYVKEQVATQIKRHNSRILYLQKSISQACEKPED